MIFVLARGVVRSNATHGAKSGHNRVEPPTASSLPLFTSSLRLLICFHVYSIFLLLEPGVSGRDDSAGLACMPTTNCRVIER